MTESFYAVHPVLLVNGIYHPALQQRILSFHIETALNQVARCTIELDTKGTLPASYEGDFAHELSVQAGTQPGAPLLFRGHLTRFTTRYNESAPPVNSMLAEDRLRRLRMTRRSQSFAEQNDGQIITSIAQQHNLQTTTNLYSIPLIYPLVNQSDQSDLDFIHERAQKLEAEFWVAADNTTLVLQARRAWGTQPALTLHYGAQLTRFEVTADLTDQRTAVQVTGWDEQSKEVIHASAGALSATTELNQGLSGSALLSQVMGDRPLPVVDSVPLNTAEATQTANSQFDIRARRFIHGKGWITGGEPHLCIGRVVALEGLGGWFSGNYYVTAVRHSFDPQTGYQTLFEVERADLGQKLPARREANTGFLGIKINPAVEEKGKR